MSALAKMRTLDVKGLAAGNSTCMAVVIGSDIDELMDDADR